MRLTVEVDLATRDRLVLNHVALVKSMAARLAQRLPAQVELNELVSVGLVGLVEAANRYRPSTGVPFDAFARRRVHGAMLDALRGLDWAPRSLRKLRRDVDAAITEVRHRTGREPDAEDIAAELKVSVGAYERMLEQLKSVDVLTMRQLDPAREPASMLDVAVDDEGPHARLEREELRAQLVEAIRELPERERQILSLYYEHGLTLAEIGEVIGVGESRVCQLRAQATARLRTRVAGTSLRAKAA